MRSGTLSLTKLLAVLLGGLLLLVSPIGCSDDPADPEDTGDTDSGEIHTDEGYIGMVIDTRPIFRKGYLPTMAQLDFADYDDFDVELPIDPITNLAILNLHNEDLTEGLRTAFGAGVAATLTITDETRAVLATVTYSELVLDDRNFTWSITTELPLITKPVALRSDLPYLVQIAGNDNLVGFTSHSYIDSDEVYDHDRTAQRFHFRPVTGLEGVYNVAVQRYDEMQDLIILSIGGRQQVCCNTDYLEGILRLTFEPDEDGYVRIKDYDTGLYITLGTGGYGGDYLYEPSDGSTKFRLISDHIAWSIADLGTVFNQPVMPPAQLDFAYSGTLRNCAPTTLEETVGNAETRTRRTTFSTTESLQLFSSQTLTFGLSIGLEIKAKIGLDLEGVGGLEEEITLSEEISMSQQYTHSQTVGQSQTWTDWVETTSEVSRVRTVSVPPYTAVEVYDAIKTIEDINMPFTQQVRVTALDMDTQQPLTGEEIQSQLVFNFVGVLITSVGDYYVDFTIRGSANIDQAFEATTNVEELENACD